MAMDSRVLVQLFTFLPLMFLLCPHTSYALLCRVCEFGAKRQELCQKVAFCPSTDVCYTELYIENDGSQTFYSGCRSRQMCEKNNALPVVGKRHTSAGQGLSSFHLDLARVRRDQKSGQNICTSCCESQDFCNEHTCNMSPASKATTCYKCDNVDSLDDCNQLTTCSDTERCYTELRYAGGAKSVFSMGCETKSICDRRELALSTSGVVGRRSIDDFFSVCLTCCNYSYCNRVEDCSTNQRAPPLSTSSPSTQSTTPGTIPNTSSPSSTTPPTTTTAATMTISTTLATTTGIEGQWCYQCSGELCGVIDSPPVKCDDSTPYCFNSYVQEVGKLPSVTKSCTDKPTCVLKWYQGTSDKFACFNLSGQSLNKVVCYYCCVGDYCNKKIIPEASTLYSNNNQG